MEFLYILLIGALIIGFILSAALGANDVGNSLGTAVGSRCITVKQASILGTIFEALGAITLGKYVFITMRTGIVNPTCFAEQNNYELLALGFFGASVGSTVWMSIATWKGWPVSSAHSIVGGIAGFALAFTPGCMNIKKMLMVLVSWVASPVLGAIGGYISYYFVERWIVRTSNPYRNALKLLPYFWSVTATILAVFLAEEALSSIDIVPTLEEWIMISVGIFVIVTLFVRFVVVPKKKKKLAALEARLAVVSPKSVPETKETLHEVVEMKQILTDQPAVSPTPPPAAVIETKEIVIEAMVKESDKLFISLLIFTAAVLTFAHGANNVANCVAPLDAIWLIYQEGVLESGQDYPPMWIVALGGFGMCFGLCTAGYIVMKTIGEKLTQITISRGYAAQLSSTLVILLANGLGIPVSSTHVTIGAVTGVGLVLSWRNVNVQMLKKILFSWGVTFPFCMGVCTLVYMIFDRYAMNTC